MKKKATAFLAVLCGLVCAAAVFLYMHQIEAEAAAQRSEALERFGGDQVEVYVATRNIAVGEVVDASNTVSRLWLIDLLPENPVTNLADIAGMQANSLIVAGEVLSHARFDEAVAHVSIPAGLQALGLELGAAQAVGGALEAGAIVDVYAAGTSTTACLAKNVLVVSVAEGTSGRLSITLAVSPEHVEEIIAATQTTTLYLSLPAKQEGDNHV